jgi:predicted  nucleic acid-binding Zn-ribbon protein
MAIPPQKFNELIRGDKLMNCPNCARIMYWAEDERYQDNPEAS